MSGWKRRKYVHVHFTHVFSVAEPIKKEIYCYFAEKNVFIRRVLWSEIREQNDLLHVVSTMYIICRRWYTRR